MKETTRVSSFEKEEKIFIEKSKVSDHFKRLDPNT